MGDDVEDEIFSTSQEALAKRKRLDLADQEEPMSIDVSKLTGKVTQDPLINNNNRFALLGELEIENDNAAPRAAQRDKAESPAQTSNRPSRKNYCPPIFMYNVNIAHLVNQLEARTVDFKIKNVNRHKSKLYFSDALVHTEMMSLLKEKKVNSYSFTPKELRQTSLIIRGLYSKTEIDEIKAAINDLVPNVVASVSKFKTSFSLKNNLDTGLFLITLISGKGLSDVSHVKYLLSQSIVWERPKKKDSEIQCRNCQLWGHIARNCNRKYKCVKCNLVHEAGECATKKEDNTDPSCVNCGETGHPANWRGCPAYKMYVADKRARLNEAREKKQTAANNVKKVVQTSRVVPGRSFASFFQNQEIASAHPSNKPPIVEEFMKMAQYFMEPEELSLEQEIQKFLDSYNNDNMPRSVAKTEFLRILNLVRRSYGP